MNRPEVKYKGITFKNPFILASAPPTRNAEMIARAFEAGWAGAVTKTICLNHNEMINVSPRMWGSGKNLLLQNIELISERPATEWVEDIKHLKRNYPENIVIASISAEAENTEAWQNLASMMQEAGADILELNLSCPHGLPEIGMGSACCDVPELSADIVKTVKQVSDIPVWVKLSANVPSISYLAKLCLGAGADGITAINTIRGFAGIDIETGLPKLDIAGKSSYGGFSGGIIKPFAMRSVAEIAASCRCFISATGGVNGWQDAVEFMMLGASTIQVCTKVMFEGYGVIDSMLDGLRQYMERHNYSTVEEIIGKASGKISGFEALNREAGVYPEVDGSSCVKCGKCFVSCRDAGYQAIEYSGGEVPVIASKSCTGCGLCAIACPVGCIALKSLKGVG